MEEKKPLIYSFKTKEKKGWWQKKKKKV